MNLWRRLDAMSRHAWPGTVMFLGLLVIGLPFGVPGQAELRPAYAMSCVFFWSLYRPAAVPAPVVAAAGVLLDLPGMSPSGMRAVLLLVLQARTLAARPRLIPQGFLMTWLVFFAFAGAGAALAWVLESLLELSMLPVGPEVDVLLAAGGVYPALAGFFIRAHRGAAAAELA